MTDGARDRLGLYVHIPFCVRKCPYCDFNTFTLEKHAVRFFLRWLQTELRLIGERFSPPPLDTLFIGGGTPTVLSGAQLSELLGWVHEYIGLSPGAEITVEANPGSVTRRGLQAMRESGINRVSLGVQSFSDEMLRVIGRNHTVRDIETSYDLIRRSGFDNVNFDLMYALPNQTFADWQATLQRAISLGPEHLSCYSLIIEEGTPFGELHARGELPLPPDDEEAAMFEYTIDTCVEAGYEHYEISNFARLGFRCRHNELYWRNESWLAAGPGAHGYWQGKRYWNERGLEEYGRCLEAGELPIDGFETPTLDEQMDETMMLGLRLVGGVDVREFAWRFGRTVDDVYGDTLARLSDWGTVTLEGDKLRLTRRGILLANRVLAEFLRGQ